MTATRFELEHFEGCAGALLHAAESEEAEAARLALEREAEELAETERQQRLEALTHAIAQLSDRAMETRNAAINSISEVIGSSLQALLPVLARQGFTAELSLAMVEILGATKIAEPVLMVSQADHDSIVETLTALKPSSKIEVQSDDSLSNGEASIRWQDGGAAISVEDLQQKASTLLERRIETILKKEPGQ